MHYNGIMNALRDIADHCVMQILRRAARTVTSVYEVHLRPTGLTASQFSVLVALGVENDMPLGLLAARIGLDRTTLTRVLGPMETRGIVVVGISGKDARSRLVRLTDAGRAVLAEATRLWEIAQSETLARLHPADWAAATASLNRLKE